MAKGRLIVIEGGDGAGKSTQTPLLVQRLIASGVSVTEVSFPRYDTSTGATVSDYLAGKFGDLSQDTTYGASAIYAVDRFASFKSEPWGKALQNGETVVASRYTTSNMIYQTAKLDRSLWSDYIDWLCEFEYERLGIPRPDLTVYLDMPCELSQKLLSKRYSGDESKKDIHERDFAYSQKCREAAMFAAEKCDWKIINCSDGENPRTIEQINDELFNLVK